MKNLTVKELYSELVCVVEIQLSRQKELGMKAHLFSMDEVNRRTRYIMFLKGKKYKLQAELDKRECKINMESSQAQLGLS